MADGSKEQTGIQSLVRAFSILEAIARNPEGVSLSQLGRDVRLHNSTVFHLVKTMMSLGYVRQAETDKRYRIGGSLFHLAAAALDEVELVGIADRHLRELALRTGETCHLAVREGEEIIIVAKCEGAGAFRIADRVGGSRPGYCTALGKVLLATLSPAQLDRYFASRELIAYTPNTVTDPSRLRHEIEEIKRSGVAFDDAEFRSELRCIAMPVRDYTRQVVAAIGMSGPIWRLSLQALQSKAPAVKEVAQRLSSELGFRQELAGSARSDDAEVAAAGSE
jgi:DNA-binding IclR family transcriptional regulator